MKTRTKVWLIIAASLVLIGCILFVGIMTTLKWDFMKLSTVKYETTSYELNETFDNISMDTDTADIIFELSDFGECRVECYEEENARHSVTVEDGTLTIKLMDDRSIYDFIRLNFSSPKIIVYLPKAEYQKILINGDTSDVEIHDDFMFKDVDISLSTGDINLKSIFAISLDISVSTGDVSVSGAACEGDITVGVSTGKVNLTNTRCKSVISKGDTGAIALNNVIAAEKFDIKRSTGDVKFTNCDAAEIYVKTDTGDVSGTLLSDKVFITETDTGRINVPKSSSGGKCEISTDTGNINISIK